MPELRPEANQRLQKRLDELSELSSSSIGSPCAQDYNQQEILPLLEYAVNNVGDPFAESIYRENTFEFEREVVNFFQKHLRGDANANIASCDANDDGPHRVITLQAEPYDSALRALPAVKTVGRS